MAESYKSFKDAYEAMYGSVKKEKQTPKPEPVKPTKESLPVTKKRGHRKPILPDKSMALKKYDSRATAIIEDILVRETTKSPGNTVSSSVIKAKNKDDKRPVEYSKSNQTVTVVKSDDLQGVIHKSNKQAVSDNHRQKDSAANESPKIKPVVYLYDTKFSYCPECGKQKFITESWTIIKSNGKRVTISRQTCPGCNAIFVKNNSENIKKLNGLKQYLDISKKYVTDKVAVDEKLSTKTEGNAPSKKGVPSSRTAKTESKRIVFPQILRDTKLLDFYSEVPVPSLIIQGKLQKVDSNSFFSFCIVNDQEVQDVSRGVFYYTHWIAREILAGIIKPEKNGRVNINGTILNVLTSTNLDRIAKNADSILQRVEIRKNGGYSRFGNRDEYNNEIVDVLMYSPFTKRYEITRASYDKSSRSYYMDITRFRSFVREYGNPGIKIWAGVSGYKGGGNFDMLNHESILYAYGYNVNQTNNLSAEYRHQILADVVDLNIMTVREIVKLITYNMNLHSQERNWLARKKWQEDIDFITDYRLEPDRFIIAKTK